MRLKLKAGACCPGVLTLAVSGAVFAQAEPNTSADPGYSIAGDLEALPSWTLAQEQGRGGSHQSELPYLMLAQAQQQPVGQAPPQRTQDKPEVHVPDLGGVLTPKGVLVIEPSWTYSHASVNRLTFRGIEILDSLLIGQFDAEDIDKDSMTFFLSGRLGVTNRFELEGKLPYIHRKDRASATVPDENGLLPKQDLENGGFGDVEIAAHYQLNDGGNGSPYYTANVRYKSTTGTGPFDVARDSDGQETELSTGSGFHAIEVSITTLYPSDPAVYFANVGYLFNLEDNVDKQIGDNFISKVDPGDSVRFNFGMAYSINQQTSFTLGYKNDFIGNTDAVIGGVTTKSRSLNVGSLLLGWNFQLDDRTSLNLGLELGVTDDAPDVSLSMRLPISTRVF